MRNCPHNGTRAWGPGSAIAPIGCSTGPRTDGQVEGGLDIRKHSRPWLTGREGPLPAAVAVSRQALAEWHACLSRAWATDIILPPQRGWRSVHHLSSSRHLATHTCSEVAAPRYG